MSVTTWPDEKVEYLKKHWGKVSCTTIGQRIGKSRNAVVNKAHRLELPLLRPSRTSGVIFETAKPYLSEFVSWENLRQYYGWRQ